MDTWKFEFWNEPGLQTCNCPHP
ncbi:hypothetical protein [Paenibacillus thiaminolyticus]